MTQREGFAADYIQVHERISAFYAKYPDGSLQSELIELSESRVVMRGLAYRTPDDQRPGIGFSSLEIPGRTPYTRGSEIENCETSAWGRAIAALGFEVKRGIATAEEVRNKEHSSAGGSSSTPASGEATGRHSLRPVASTQPPEVSMDDADEGTCPYHHKPWRQNARGWYCASKNDDGRWCDEHPTQAWAQAHKVA